MIFKIFRRRRYDKKHLFSNAILLYNRVCKDTTLFMALEYIKMVRFAVLNSTSTQIDNIILAHTNVSSFEKIEL